MSGSSLLDIFIGNLFRFDLIIFVVAAIDFWCFLLVRRVAKKLFDKMYQTIFVPTHNLYYPMVYNNLGVYESDVIAMRKKTAILYNVFSTLSSLFTLLGILGTVISLIPMVNEMESVKTNFFVALTSTFWGLVFALIFKILDASVSGRIEDNEKTVALFLERNARSVFDQK